MKDSAFKAYRRQHNESAFYNPPRSPLNSPEDERQQQILEHQRRLHNPVQKKPQQKKPALSFEEKLKRTYQWMAAAFPETFGDNSMRRPLSLHILRDLKQHYHKSKTPHPEGLVLRAAVTRYLGWSEYLETVITGAPRYDLQGRICGEVTEEEMRQAQALICKAKEGS
jgi:hypothetical protein